MWPVRIHLIACEARSWTRTEKDSSPPIRSVLRCYAYRNLIKFFFFGRVTMDRSLRCYEKGTGVWLLARQVT